MFTAMTSLELSSNYSLVYIIFTKNNKIMTKGKSYTFSLSLNVENSPISRNY